MNGMALDIAAIVQLALAPAFLLVGIGQFLVLAAGRLGRVVDRAREIGEILPAEPGPDHRSLVDELKMLDKRMSVVNASIFFGTAAMICVCVVVACLFFAHFAALDLSGGIAFAFIAVMALLITGLVLFLWEVRLANRSIHVRTDLVGPNRK